MILSVTFNERNLCDVLLIVVVVNVVVLLFNAEFVVKSFSLQKHKKQCCCLDKLFTEHC